MQLQENMTALVTGGVSGLGEATAVSLLERGLNVVAVDLNDERGRALSRRYDREVGGQITAAQVRAGDFAPRNSAELERTLAYLDQLEAQGSYTLMVWPMHCEIGSWGHGVHASVLKAYRDWEESQLRAARHVFKGMNPWSEHYSAIRAEVPDPQDPGTSLNRTLLTHLAAFDTVVIAGEASSHCVRATTEHIVEHWGGNDYSRIVLLTDCMSPVAGFEAAHHDFLQRMRAIGVRCETSASFGL